MSQKAARRLWGSITAGPRNVEIRGLGSLETIPYDRIASVHTSWWHATIELETGAQTRTIAIWNPFRLAPIAQAIRLGIEDAEIAATTPPYVPMHFRVPEAPPTRETLTSVDDGGPGEFGTFRRRDGSAYEDLEPQAGR